MTNSDLRFIYKRANKLYWRNKLPKDVVVKFADFKRKPQIGVMRFEIATFKPRYILVSKEIKNMRAVCILTVLHEMCHVEFPKRKGHQGWHDRRMLKLAKAGAFNGLW